MSSIPIRRHPVDEAVTVARDREDVVVGNEIVRHRLASRLVHWTVAVTFFLGLLTGMPIWAPVFGWMSHLLGGLSVCRIVHRWVGIAFTLISAVQFFHWRRDMRLAPEEKRTWLGPGVIRYLRYEDYDPNVGKYNGGQKLFFFAATLGAVGLLASGLVMWFHSRFPEILREASYLLHDVTVVLFVAAVIWHIYLGTTAEPGTFGSMVRGTVTKTWARLHHPKWYREVTGEE
jgi:formate dehydrogenase subunit gamma